MKKAILGFIGCLAVSTSVTATDVKHDFGGYWRTRAYIQDNFSGDDTGSSDKELIDARARIYYTAHVDNAFKFVNKFEIDTAWGDDTAGDIGTDGKAIFEVKNSYVEFAMKDTIFKIGLQGGAIGRGFLFDDDFAGLNVKFKAGDATIPVTWVKAVDDDAQDDDPENNRVGDDDYFAINPTFKLNDKTSLTPYLLFDYSNDDEKSVLFVGADLDMKLDNWSLWGTAIIQTGDLDADTDTTAFLLAAGAKFGNIHGQFFYASGDDDDADSSNDAFVGVDGRSYYWAEIMGYGIFDNQASNNAPDEEIENIMAFNIGLSHRLSDVTTLQADLWYASLAEGVDIDGDEEKNLGVEVDLKLSHKINSAIKLDLVMAYLAAGDATGEEDPIEVGTRLSFCF